jgi:hypothetical protein
MFRPIVACLALALPCVSVPAVGMDAAPPSSQGTLLVDQGQGYAPMQPGARLTPGMRVMALGGPAKLTYADGCTVAVDDASLTTVGQASPCAGGARLIQASDITTTNFGSNRQVSDDASGGGAGASGPSPFWLVGAGLGAAIITIAVVASNDHNNNNNEGGTGGGTPVSP